jgi:hypothetical protein
LSQPVGAAVQGGIEEVTTRHAPLTANMDPVLLAKVSGTLFPRQDSDAGRSGSSLSSGRGETSSTTTAATTSTERSEKLQVTQEDLAATKQMASRNVALGPDGVPGRIWAETMELVAPHVRHLFTRCLREGIYQRMWRTARLVLLRKEGRPPDSPSAYRLICLLDEIGKLFEMDPRLSGGPHRGAGSQMARQSVRLSPGSLHGGCCEAGEEHGG